MEQIRSIRRLTRVESRGKKLRENVKTWRDHGCVRGDRWSFPICERHFCDLHVSRWKVIAISSSPRNFSSFRYWNLFLNTIRLFFYRVKNNNISEDEKGFVDRAKNPRLIQDISIIWIHRVLFERRMLSYNVSQSAETTENKHIQKMKIELILYPRNISFYRYIYRKCLQNIRKETGKASCKFKYPCLWTAIFTKRQSK